MTAPTHLCLVSDQPVPSLTPLLDPRLGVRQVTLVAAPERRHHAGWLKHALSLHDIAADIVPLRDSYDLSKLLEDFNVLAQRHPDGIDLNLTGGTKLMSIAAWEVFTRQQDRLYYVDIRRDAIIPIRPAGPTQPIADLINLDVYLAGLGVAPHTGKPANRDAIPASRAELFRQLMPGAGRNALKHMERWLMQFGANGAKLPIGAAERAKFGRLLGPLRHAGIIQLHGNGDQADALSIDTAGRRFVSGGWLEDYAFHILDNQRQRDRRITDLARAVTIHLAGEGNTAIYNEIDVAWLWNNTLFLVECKGGKPKGNWDDMLYKLHSLRERLGGLRSGCLLIAADEPTANARARADLMDIHLITGAQLNQLDTTLTAWFERESQRLVRRQ